MTAAPDLQRLLSEVETIAVDVARTAAALLDDGLTTKALDCCHRIRKAIGTNDISGAALAGSELGELLMRLRELGETARRDAAYVSRADKTYEQDVKRRAVFNKYHFERKFSISKAYEKAAEELGESVRTIRRARRER